MNDQSLNSAMTMRSGEDAASLGRVDQYEILRELGGGGFGTVYLAKDTVSGVDVAVKGLPPLVKNNKEELENIRQNFVLVSRLHHPNIAAALVLHPANKVSYSDKATSEKLRVFAGDTLMVMEYAPGVTLSQWRRQFPDKRVPMDKAIAITRQIAEALDYAHERKIIHRDIKPSNIMIETSAEGVPTARVLDFGLAAEIRSSMGRVSREIHDTSGTRPYMAPEQWSGDRQGPATDQYALAVLFYELIVGEVPFASVFDCGDPIVMLSTITTRPVKVPDDLPKNVQLALKRGLGKERESRFATCADFVAALEGRKVAKPGGTHSRASALVGVAAALAFAAGGVWWWQGREASGTSGMDGTNVTAETPPVVASTNAVSIVPEVPPVADVPVAPPAPPVDEETERRRLELEAGTAVYSLSVEMESASRLIAGEPEEVRAFFTPEILAFEKMYQAGNDAKSNRNYVTATNFFAQAKAKADALKELVTARANCLTARERAEVAKRSADAVDAKSALALRYEEAEKTLGAVSTLAEKRDFAVASARAEAARGQFAALRADVIKVALDEAGRHKTAERWEDCLSAAEKVLGWEPQNATAAALKSEAEEGASAEAARKAAEVVRSPAQKMLDALNEIMIRPAVCKKDEYAVLGIPLMGVVRSFSQDLEKQTNEWSRLIVMYTENHPEVIEQTRLVDAAKRNLADAISKAAEIVEKYESKNDVDEKSAIEILGKDIFAYEYFERKLPVSLKTKLRVAYDSYMEAYWKQKKLLSVLTEEHPEVKAIDKLLRDTEFSFRKSVMSYRVSRGWVNSGAQEAADDLTKTEGAEGVNSSNATMEVVEEEGIPGLKDIPIVGSWLFGTKKTTKISADDSAAGTVKSKGYVVKSGDTLAKIAYAHNMTIRQIRELNPETKKDVIRVGQKLRVFAVARQPCDLCGGTGRKRCTECGPIRDKSGNVLCDHGIFCPVCKGSGNRNTGFFLEPCSDCNGRGWERHAKCAGSGFLPGVCPKCKGEKTICAEGD